MKVLSLFSGIGAFEKALFNLSIDFDLVGFSEIDKYAAKAYTQIHNVNESLNLGDVTKINADSLGKIDLITYGFPCQDISVAGKQKGLQNSDGSKTRSGLFFEALRIISKTKPKIAIAENVKALTFKKFADDFKTVLDSLKQAEYNNYYKVLNAKDYGVPQNRERIFIVSIRKDIDTGSFEFEQSMPLVKRLRDVLEQYVEDKFYLDNERTSKLIERIKSKYFIEDSTEVKQVGNLLENTKFKNPQRGRVYDIGGLSPCLNTVGGGGLEPKIIQVGRWGAGGQRNIIYSNRGICPTITATTYKGPIMHTDGLSIRKLTPKECWRLMGFSDSDFGKVIGISNSQLYKMAGNSIVVNVLESIFKQLKQTGLLNDKTEI